MNNKVLVELIVPEIEEKYRKILEKKIDILTLENLEFKNEIKDLIVAFNEIQDMTSNNIKQIQSNQELLMEKERLASLGQMIGGIAHNLKTPIFSIAGGLEGLSDLINE